jgi:hypothetical protein
MVVSPILGQGIERVLEMTSYRSLVTVELAVNVSRGLQTSDWPALAMAAGHIIS